MNLICPPTIKTAYSADMGIMSCETNPFLYGLEYDIARRLCAQILGHTSLSITIPINTEDGYSTLAYLA